jgi:pimeloyl-ACP methyl ester carboxylesterase
MALALLLVVSVSGCLGAHNAAGTSHLILSTCAVQGVAARCGQLAVPENPDAANGRKISLRVVVIPARSSDRAPDPLFYLAGGPGGAATDSTAWAYSHFNLLNQRHDIVLVDQRGTGGSNQATCSLTPSEPTEAGLAAAIKDCLTSTKAQADPEFYSTPLSVDDFDLVRAALGYDRIDLYGGSYGVSSGLAYIQRHGDRVRTALFESGSLLDVHLWEQVPVSAQHSLDEVFARCAAEPACAASFPNLKDDFAAVTGRLAKTPVTSELVDPAGGFRRLDLQAFLSFVIDDYLSDIRLAASLPKDIHAAAGGDWTAFLKLLTESAGSNTSTPIMFVTIICSDEWAVRSPSTIASIGAGSEFTPMSLADASLSNAACKYWPHAAGASGPVNSRAPIVFLNGTADPADPPANVAGAEATLPNSLVVPIAGFGHGVIDQDSTSCLADKATTFIEIGRPSTLSSWTCPNLLPAFVDQ